MYLQAYQRCDFYFRRCQAVDWDTSYLNHSMAYEAIRENELFAISQGIRNFRTLKTADPNLFTPQDKELMYQLIRKLFQPLSREEQQVCLNLSLFPRFSRAQAEFICPHPDTLARLEEHWKRSSFLAYEPSQGTFAFHPVFQEYLQGQFQEESWSWQKKPISEPPGGSSTAGILPRPLPWPSREKPGPRPSRQWNGRALAKKRPPCSDPP